METESLKRSIDLVKQTENYRINQSHSVGIERKLSIKNERKKERKKKKSGAGSSLGHTLHLVFMSLLSPLI